MSLCSRMSAILMGIASLVVSGCTGVPSGVEPVSGFDVNRYAGTWYEIARLDHSFERGLNNVTATYALRDDGTIEVVNRGYDPKTCRVNTATGTARFQGVPDIASLSVTFFWPFSGGYHVMVLDKVNYDYALVAGPSRSYLWVLARTPDLEPTTLDDLVAFAGAREFPVEDLIYVEHGPEVCEGETK